MFGFSNVFNIINRELKNQDVDVKDDVKMAWHSILGHITAFSRRF